jgi:hypothetical protein
LSGDLRIGRQKAAHENAVYTYCILMRMDDGKISGVPYCPSTGAGRTETGDFSSEWGDGEFSAELLIRRADSIDVIPAEAGMTFRARHYWFGLDPA